MGMFSIRPGAPPPVQDRRQGRGHVSYAPSTNPLDETTQKRYAWRGSAVQFAGRQQAMKTIQAELPDKVAAEIHAFVG
jgi:hypothetical protein